MASKQHIYVDLETSGLDPLAGAVILAVGAVAELTGRSKAGQVTEFMRLVRPTEEQWAKASPRALEVNGLTWERLQVDGKPWDEVKDDFLRWAFENKINATNHVFVGQNPKFDLSFLRQFMTDELAFIGFPMESAIDCRDIYSILVNRRKVPFLAREKGGRTSENISNALGLPPEPFPHDALEGAKAAMQNFLKMSELLAG